MNTVFLLMAQYNTAIIPVEDLCRDYFKHLDATKFLRKARTGAIALAVVAIEDSQKSAHGVHINDLADYLDKQHAAARKKFERLQA